MKQYGKSEIVIPLLAASLKNIHIPLSVYLSALYEIYTF